MRGTTGTLQLERGLASWPYEVPDGEPRTGYQELRNHRAAVGRFLNAPVEEIALTQNATMGMGFLAQGLDRVAGDEVVSTNHEHRGSTAAAEPITFTFGATITGVGGAGEVFAAEVGDSVTGFFSFDSLTPDLHEWDSIGSYEAEAQLALADDAILRSPGEIRIRSEAGSDTWRPWQFWTVRSPTGVAGAPPGSFGAYTPFLDYYDTDDLQLVPPPAPWYLRVSVYNDSTSGEVGYVSARLTSFEGGPAPVPEPGSLALLALGLAAMAIAGGREAPRSPNTARAVAGDVVASALSDGRAEIDPLRRRQP